MKKKICGGIIVLTISIITVFNVNLNMQNNNSSYLSLANVEALAQEPSTEKKYRYETWNNSDCYIYVGGAYAKGKKVTCWDGSDHPICVDCTL